MTVQYERMYVDSRFGQMHMRSARPEKRTIKKITIAGIINLNIIYTFSFYHQRKLKLPLN